MKEIKEAIERAKRDDVTFGNSNITVTMYCFTEYRLLHSLSLVAENFYTHGYLKGSKCEEDDYKDLIKQFTETLTNNQP